MSRYLLGLMILAGFLLPASASAQEGAAFPVPAGAVSAGYVARWDDGRGQAERRGQGWQSQVVFNVNRWFGIAGEISGTYDHYGSSFVGGRRVGRYAYLGGPRFFTQRGRLMPFAQLLAGGQFDDVRNWFNTGVALQPGAGIIVRATEQVGVQVSGDYQRAIYVDDSGPEGRVRLGAGIVFTWGTR